jgi:hypothetical protein
MLLSIANKVFLAPLPGMDFISVLGECVKKYQQAFLALLPGMDFISVHGECIKKY